MRFIWRQRGFTSYGFQIGRLYCYWPKWKYFKLGIWPSFGIEEK